MEHDDDQNESESNERTTAPQSPYTNREVGIGFIIFVLGSILVFAIPQLFL